MKKIFTLIAVLFSITTFAAPGPKTSKIAFSNNYRATMVQIKIDGVMYTLDNDFVMDNIRPGSHSITIYKVENRGFRRRSEAIYNSVLLVSPSQKINFDINRNGKVVVKYAADKSNRNDRDDRNYNGRDNRW